MLAVSIVLGAINLAILIVLLVRLSEKEKSQERSERLVRDELAKNREELTRNLSLLSDSLSKQLSALTQSNEAKLEGVRGVIDTNLRALQDDNSKKLEQMRATVDEKLHSTLEKRLGDSFKLVSDQLDRVHKGLGEMQTLASGVGDLKKVLSNVKTRGTWGEVQLGSLLEQILTPDQYVKNVMIKKGSREAVEFAIKFPSNKGQTTLLPIDAKFPLEDYQRLQDAQERADIPAIESAGKAIEARLKLEAKNIRDKYIDPPNTTDYGILFLPTEGLYAEVLRRPGFADSLQREFRVVVTGPTTIAALLSSLQMVFQTLAVEKRASEVWQVLSNVKKEFGNFGEILERTQKQLQAASNTIADATSKSRTIERKLKDVQELPGASSAPLIEQKVVDLERDVRDESLI